MLTAFRDTAEDLCLGQARSAAPAVPRRVLGWIVDVSFSGFCSAFPLVASRGSIGIDSPARLESRFVPAYFFCQCGLFSVVVIFVESMKDEQWGMGCSVWTLQRGLV